MDVSESTPNERKTEKNGRREPCDRMLMSTKPLHRFLCKDPRSFGIVLLIFGCAELLMGFQLVYVNETSSVVIYSPYWEGALFAICGTLSIYTDRQPSKRMVTVCLAMYIVSILGFFVSLGSRIFVFSMSFTMWYRAHQGNWTWGFYKVVQILSIETILLICSACVFVLLIFLSTVARFALKSTHTEVVVQCVTNPPGDTTLD